MTEISPLIFTSQAAGKVRELLEDEDNKNLKLRVYITGGGCSGFQYGFTFDESIFDDDSQVNTEGVLLLIDAMSIQYMMGATIDYIEDIQGARFIIDNPSAVTTCGCGSSFSV